MPTPRTISAPTMSTLSTRDRRSCGWVFRMSAVPRTRTDSASATSLSAGYVAGGLLSLVGLPMLWLVRRIGGPGDQIEGDGRDTVTGTCAAEGLPAVAQLESQPVPERMSR